MRTTRLSYKHIVAIAAVAAWFIHDIDAAPTMRPGAVDEVEVH